MKLFEECRAKEKKDLKVSIITVCYNSEQTIKKTIEHVLNQTYKNIEYIVVDGGSNDSTVQIVKAYEPCFNGRMKWISESDAGIYDAMNKGIKLATGDLIGISNSDDWLELDAVEIVTEHFRPEYDQIIYGFLAMRKKDGMLKRIIYINHEIIQEENIPHPTCFISKRTYERLGLYGMKYKIISDYEYMLKAYLDGKVQFCPVYAILANFTEGGTSSSVDCEKEIIQLKREYGIINTKTYLAKTIILFIKKIIRGNI